ncbi:hypothetical protein [Mucilaginibacter sp.]|uniref:nSTAND1 domain-containing NTPase n=1 Tax=Mucilaginibacter sp. TaxID=1882438 RepID=UPI0025E6E369|nr:hypothetical protein [Mucilaginibacter sp.]
MAESAQNKFIGARSYEEKDKDIFFGRDNEANDLFQLVNINTFTLLYGKSGLGKTSVLQAGLFPKLRNGNYVPIYIRPNYRDPVNDFVKDVERIIMGEWEKKKVAHKKIKSKQTLWEYFHTDPLAQPDQKTQIPVLVFDQFEEIFTIGTEDKSTELRKNTMQFIEFLSDLIENSPPEYLDETTRLELQYKYGQGQPRVKIVFSFREEYLGDFYSLSTHIPSIAYSNLQYKLTPLSYKKGYDIIKAAGGGLFEEGAIKEILKVISESATDEDAEKRDIDSFLLSVFCENQIENFKPGQGPQILAEHIKKVDIQSVIDEEYNSGIKELELNDSEIRLLEERLLSPEGYRWPVYLDLALSYSNGAVREDKIRALENKKILKRYSIDGRRVIEIIHDKYALAVKSNRDFRTKAEREQLQLLEDQEKLKQQKIAEGLKLSEARAAFADQQVSDKEDKIKAQKKTQRWTMIAALVLLLFAVIAVFSFREAKQQRDIANQKVVLANKINSSLTVEKAKVTRLVLAQQDSAKVLALLNHQLINKNTQIEAARKQAIKNLNYAYKQADVAKMQKNLAFDAAARLAVEKTKTDHLLDSVKGLITRYNTATNVGQLLTAAKNFANNEPAASYRLAQLAHKQDPENSAVSHFLDSVKRYKKHFEVTTVAGRYSKFAPDGNSFIAIDSKGGAARLFNLQGDLLFRIVPGDGVPILSAQFSPDGKRCLFTSAQTAYLFDLTNGKLIKKVIEGGLSFASFLPFHPDRFITVAAQSVKLWKNDSQTSLYSIPTGDEFLYAVSSDRTKLFTTSDEGGAIYDLETGKLIHRTSDHSSGQKFSNYFIIPKSNEILCVADGVLTFWDNNGQFHDPIKLNALQKGYTNASVAVFSQDGTKLLISLTGSREQQQQQQQQQQQRGITSKEVYREPITLLVDLNNKTSQNFGQNVDLSSDASFSPDGTLILLSPYSLFTDIADSDTRKYTIAVYHTSYPTTKEISFNNMFILTSFNDNETKLWTYGQVEQLDAAGKLQKMTDAELFIKAGIKQ